MLTFRVTRRLKVNGIKKETRGVACHPGHRVMSMNNYSDWTNTLPTSDDVWSSAKVCNPFRFLSGDFCLEFTVFYGLLTEFTAYFSYPSWFRFKSALVRFSSRIAWYLTPPKSLISFCWRTAFSRRDATVTALHCNKLGFLQMLPCF